MWVHITKQQQKTCSKWKDVLIRDMSLEGKDMSLEGKDMSFCEKAWWRQYKRKLKDKIKDV